MKKGTPTFRQGGRVADRGGEQSGRVQAVTFREDEFWYVVKWDRGPTTPHPESQLKHEPLPPHYP